MRCALNKLEQEKCKAVTKHRPSPLAPQPVPREVSYQLTSPLPKYLGGLGVGAPKKYG
jgi:hypothetical protein